jgi:hypothetical protein
MEKFSCRDFRRHVNRKPCKTTQENSARKKSGRRASLGPVWLNFPSRAMLGVPLKNNIHATLTPHRFPLNF